jgi:hypothetical protein
VVCRHHSWGSQTSSVKSFPLIQNADGGDESVSQTLVYFNHLTRLSALETFIELGTVTASRHKHTCHIFLVRRKSSFPGESVRGTA